MRINTNVSSLTAQEAAQNTTKTITSSLEKLSTGFRINKASDDASGLAIADKLRTQATSINQGIANGNSAVSLLQIADKSMAEQSNILDTIKSKLIQANTDTTSADGRESIRKDINKLLTQLDNIAKQTNYNGTTLLQAGRDDTGVSSGLSFQVGEKSGDTITNTGIQANTSGLALGDLKGLTANGLTASVASAQQSIIDSAITTLNGYRGDIGSTQNQVESAVRNLMTQATNVKAAESIIRDVDYAQESANFNKQNIISQAGSYAISQANAVQQNVLRLLQ
ncbi:flagellin N-terminal helical domain-containing protein [Arcobacter cloacae]|uniref:Flagellin n=1 Tax=Arcobacter cloacae TaxID=1054034 RepID=A0A4Q0ZF35_9BACT|nr:flagellin [Arcobacter cloacae]RXJ84410.1 flagellin [Arcobacter cloacae]